MEERRNANECLKTARGKHDRDFMLRLKSLKEAHDNSSRDYDTRIAKLDDRESTLNERLVELNRKKRETAEANGDVNAADGDLVEINAGGEIVSAKRSTLTQIKGTRLEALFSGRWDQKLQRDGNGRIFLDVNPVGFRAIVDYLNEMAISSENDPPSPPTVNDEYNLVLRHQLELFGILDTFLHLDSKALRDLSHLALIHDWLKEDCSTISFSLLYRGSQDGLSNSAFHSTCDDKGCTLTIIETTNGFVLGGYANTPWASSGGGNEANRAFLFVLAGPDIPSPYKMKLRNPFASAVYHGASYGPIFGSGHDLRVDGSSVDLNFGQSYESNSSQQLTNGYRNLLKEITIKVDGSYTSFAIKEMEVFQVISMPLERATQTLRMKHRIRVNPVENKNIFLKGGINKAIKSKLESLLQAESETCRLEDDFKDEHDFIDAFAIGDVKDVVVLNVSGTTMVTKRSTLCISEDSVLAQQFDDSKWTEQGHNTPRVNEWSLDEVCAWVQDISDIPENVSSIFKENEITGRELLALGVEGLKTIGIERAGTLFLLLEEIKMLKQASSDIVTLIEHSPYCFGKILNYLRLKQLHSQGLVEESALPNVCDMQQSRFERVVKYYFPGDSAKFILG